MTKKPLPKFSHTSIGIYRRNDANLQRFPRSIPEKPVPPSRQKWKNIIQSRFWALYSVVLRPTRQITTKYGISAAPYTNTNDIYMGKTWSGGISGKIKAQTWSLGHSTQFLTCGMLVFATVKDFPSKHRITLRPWTKQSG